MNILVVRHCIREESVLDRNAQNSIATYKQSTAKSSVILKVDGSKTLRTLIECGECGTIKLGRCCTPSGWKRCRGCTNKYLKGSGPCKRCRNRRKHWLWRGKLREKAIVTAIQKVLKYNKDITEVAMIKGIQYSARPVQIPSNKIKTLMREVKGSEH